MFYKARAIDWWHSRGQTTLQNFYTNGELHFCDFFEKLRENKFKNRSKMASFAKLQMPRLQAHLQKNLEVISKNQRQFKGGPVDYLHGAKRIRVIALTVRSVGGSFFFAWFDAYLRL